jgi:hypothetical protein
VTKTRLPRNILTGLLVGVLACVIAGFAHPADTEAFYGATVQVVPVFLVAVALERTLGEILGTESSALAEELARVEREWTPPSRMTRAYYGVGLKLRDHAPLRVSPERVRAADGWLAGRSASELAAELVSEDNVDGVRFLDTVAKLTALASDEPAARANGAALAPSTLLEEWDKVNGTLMDDAKTRATEAVRFTVSMAYRARRDQQRLSVVASVNALAAAESLAFVGLLSPGAPYTGLLAATAGAAAASFVAVTVDAVINLLAPDVDIQSAGLDWPSVPASDSHWDAL